ncbi:MAG: type II/IV secretion system protein [Phascolarctobacterium sp.]|nr:type II/IV secretion system protein [Phascolarctobacterium sp.]
MKLDNLFQQNVFSNDSSGAVQVINFINHLLEQALLQNASDIHIEPVEELTRVRLRIDGLLQKFVEVPRSNHNAIVSRIKIISGLDIAEKRLPQDGRIEADVNGRKVDLRISTLPVIDGEKVVIRILDKGKQLKNLAGLSFSSVNFVRYKELISYPHGMVLITGPTGSGKSTTLYATLEYLNDESQNIITIEDPVEFKIKGVNQISVNNKAGLTFAKGLRSIVRQDPNIIMVGEIRDGETARIAVQAALTGHLVFSTIHTNTAIGAITRLIDLGIEPFLVAAALRGVVAQRLVRTICVNCKEQYAPTNTEISSAGLSALASSDLDKFSLCKGAGCENCNHSGYKGRVAVQEVLAINDNMKSLIISGASERALLDEARTNNFTTLIEDCAQKVLQGVTSVEELLRVAYC